MLSFLDKLKFLETVQAVIRTGYSLCLIRLYPQMRLNTVTHLYCQEVILVLLILTINAL